jgi:hypothetical protein
VIQLEKYKGTKSRFVCPNCNTQGSFVRYVGNDGIYLADAVGRCNRESKCGYHYKPKQFFADNPTSSKLDKLEYLKKKKLQQLLPVKKDVDCFGVIDSRLLRKTLSNYQQNSFVQFLSDLFSNETEAVQRVLNSYFIGTWNDALTIFWQIDQKGRIRTGKIMRFDVDTGKRQTVRTWVENGEKHELKAYWIHKELIKRKELKPDFLLKQCFFGEHLLRKETGEPIGVVEAEKTALICAIKIPEMLWLAVGAKGYLTEERFQVFSGRKVLLFPDADAYSDWKEKAVRAQRSGFDVHISNLIEKRGTDSEKGNGFDLADYMIKEIRRENETKIAYESLLKNQHFNGWTEASLF